MERPTPKLFNCETCKKNFKFNWSLKVHKQIHSGAKPYKCSLCESSFRTLRMHKYHQVNQHSVGKSFLCEFCNKEFMWKSTLDRHQATHTAKGKPLKCDICQQGFKHKQTLSLHYQHVHNPNPPVVLECLFCRKQCPARSKLENHLFTHTMETPYFCNICSSEFNQVRSLRRHMETHKPTREKGFQCELCTKPFYTKVDMRQHLIIHTGEKPFKCEICRKEFTTNGNLKVHYMAHSNANDLKCQICGQTFKSRSGFNYHKKIHLMISGKPTTALVSTYPTIL